MRRAAEFARKYRYALKCDVRKYFPSIDHEVLLGLLDRVIGDARLLNLIQHILDSHQDGSRQEWPVGGDLFDVRIIKRGLPIGNLTSQFFANVYLNPLDHFVKHELRVKGYVRYMDDFLLFGNDRQLLKEQGQTMQGKLAELRLSMHPDKYRLLHTSAGVDFAGYVVFASGRIRMRSASVRRFQRRYRRLLWEVKRNQREPSQVTESVRAWVAHARHAQSVGLRRAVLYRQGKPGWPGANSSNRGLRGGSFNNNNDNLHAANRNNNNNNNNNNPTNENNNIGFRVASP